MARQTGWDVGTRHLPRVRLEHIFMTGFVLIIYLIGGLMTYDDTLTFDDCHRAAETLKEGGHVVVDGVGTLSVETASCVLDSRKQFDSKRAT